MLIFICLSIVMLCKEYLFCLNAGWLFCYCSFGCILYFEARSLLYWIKDSKLRNFVVSIHFQMTWQYVSENAESLFDLSVRFEVKTSPESYISWKVLLKMTWMRDMLLILVKLLLYYLKSPKQQTTLELTKTTILLEVNHKIQGL